MKKICLLLVSCLGLFHVDAYGVSQKKSQHLDKADISNRTNGENFKSYALMSCLQMVDQKLKRPVNKDLQWSTSGYFQEWIDLDLENTQTVDHLFSEIDRLSKKYIKNAGGLKHNSKATIYTAGCLDLYYSDELDRLMKRFVIRPNKDHRW